MAYKYHKSDFSLLIELNAKRINTFGEEIVVNTGYPFELKFFSSKQSSASAKFNVDNMDTYVASYDGTTAKNCQVLDDKHVLVYFDHTEFEFSPGMLYVETHSKVPDTRFEGDEVQNIKRLYTTGIELTDIADLDNDDTSELKIDLLMVYFTGINNKIETDEAARVAAEKARAQAENARVSAENARVSAENARVSAESARVTAWTTLKQTIESWYNSTTSAWTTWFDATKTEWNDWLSAKGSDWTTWFDATKTEWNEWLSAKGSDWATWFDATKAEWSEWLSAKGSDWTTWFDATKAAWSTFSTRADEAEEARASAETARAEAETNRVTAESSRVSAESARADEETKRVKAESSRASAESARVSAETARANAETTRQSQESARQTNTATAITNANAATATALKSAKCQPKIQNGTWWVYDVEQDKFVDTGFAANTDYQLTEAKMLAALPSISAVSITDSTEYPDLF